MAYRTETAAKKSTPPLLRNAHLMAFESLLHQNGVLVDRYLRRNGLPMLCDDPDAYLPLQKVWSFFDDAARHEDPQLGWLVGTHVGNQKVKTNLLLKIETAPTLLLGMRRLMQMIGSEATDIDIGIHERRDDVLFYMRYPGMREAPGYMISQAYQIELILDLIRHFLGRHWIPREIGIESPSVPPAAKAHFPGTQFLTRQRSGFIAVPRSCLHRTALLGGVNVGGAVGLVPAEKFDYLATLRAVLKAYLSEGYLSERFAAELMNTSVRTLTRRLSTYGLTYGALIDELRFKSAKEQLQKPSARIGDVALSVGFSDQGDFTRMFRRIGGLTPLEFRNASREE